MNLISKTARPKVLAVHPNLERLPANLLRAHIVFDRPMQTAEALKYIKLIDDCGDNISNALLDLTDGLWTTDGKILTILFHPGRIKTGLVAGDRYGSIFTEGRTYQLVVSDKILGANSKPLESNYRHSFEIIPAIRQAFSAIPDKLLLKENVVRIETNRPLDWLSVQTYLAVTDESGNLLKSHFSVTADGKAIAVRLPDAAHDVRRFLRVHPQLEDIAGNQANVPFEVNYSIT